MKKSLLLLVIPLLLAGCGSQQQQEEWGYTNFILDQINYHKATEEEALQVINRIKKRNKENFVLKFKGENFAWFSEKTTKRKQASENVITSIFMTDENESYYYLQKDMANRQYNHYSEVISKDTKKYGRVYSYSSYDTSLKKMLRVTYKEDSIEAPQNFVNNMEYLEGDIYFEGFIKYTGECIDYINNENIQSIEYLVSDSGYDLYFTITYQPITTGEDEFVTERVDTIQYQNLVFAGFHRQEKTNLGTEIDYVSLASFTKQEIFLPQGWERIIQK